MFLRAVMISLAAMGLLSSIAPHGAWAQDRARGTAGRFAQGEGGRGREAGRGFGGFSLSGRGSYGYGLGGFGGPGGGWRGGDMFGGRGEFAYPDRPYASHPYPSDYPPPPAGYGRPFGGGDWRNQQNEVRQAVRDGRHIPLGRAIDAVRQRSPGRELDAGLEPGPNGRTMYRVRWAAANGRRIDYLVDAATGAIVSIQGGR